MKVKVKVKALLVLLFVLGAFLFLPTTALASRPECPLSSEEPEADLGKDASSCGFESEQTVNNHLKLGESGQSHNGERISAPLIQSGQAAHYAGTAETNRNQITAKNTPQSTVHIVKPAETLVKIAKTYQTSIEVLLLANPQIANPNLIYINDQVRIPSPDEIDRLRSEEERRRVEAQRQVVANTPHNGERWVDVDLQYQTVRVYEGDKLVNTFIVSTGRSRTPTVTGQFRVWLKLASDDMRGPGYDLKAVPYVLYFYKDYALHGTYWHHNFGTPMSHGCVNLSTEDAAWLYDFSSVGTLVNVH